MNVRSIEPLAEAREFRPEEIFFSTTDYKGVILFGNDVFARVSGFSKPELYGQPHNIIRHPDMPRAAFALLWANLHEGRPFAGYVKNMAKDGRYYWVFVVAVPVSNRRFLSVRFKPGTPLLATVEALYKQMLATENASLEAGGTEKQAVAASLQVALTALTTLGFSGYDAFAQLALNQEMKARDRKQLTLATPAFQQISTLFHHLDGFVALNLSLQQNATDVLTIAESFRLHAFNVNIAAQRFGEAGTSLGVVAGFLGDYAGEMGRDTAALRNHIAGVVRMAENINTLVSIAHLQMEMILYYQAEQAAKPGGVEPEEIKTLEECFGASSGEARQGIASLRTSLPQLCASRDAITKIALAIDMSQVLGHTETARIPDSEALKNMFLEFRVKMNAARSQLDALSQVIDRITTITGSSSAVGVT